MEDKVRRITFEDAQLTLLNFKGKEGPYNKEGDRNFCILLPEDIIDDLIADEWNVRYLKPREGEDTPRPILQVTVRYDIRPPLVVLITSTTRTQLDEKTIEVLDYANIKLVDLIVRQYYWNFGGRSGFKAYVQSMFVTIEEDELERKYKIHEDPPQSPEEPF